MARVKMPDRLRKVLDELDVPHEVAFGKGDHIKIFVGGVLVGCAPCHRRESTGRPQLNLESRIRRAAKEYKIRVVS